MARKNEYGRFTLSAGEIGAYTVCPEAWRLSNIEKVKVDQSRVDQHIRVQKGNELHKEWAQTVDEAVYLARHAKLIFFLIVLCVAAFLLSQY